MTSQVLAHAPPAALPTTGLAGAPKLFALLMASILLDVGGSFGLKYSATLVVVGYLALNARAIRLPASTLRAELALFAVAPALFLCLSVTAYRVPPRTAVGSLMFFSAWAVFPLLLAIPRAQLVNIFTRYMYRGALLTLVAFVAIIACYALGRLDLITRINEFAEAYNVGFFGQRPTDGGLKLFVPNVYFRWTMLLIPAAACLADDRRRLLPVLLALLCTLSTGSVLFGLAGVALVPLADSRVPLRRLARHALWLALTVAAVSLALAATQYGDVAFALGQKLTSGSASTGAKLGHIRSILDQVFSNPAALLVGSGVGSAFYSVGADGVVTNVEVSHFNLLRQFGIVYTLLFVAYVGGVFAGLLRSDGAGRRLGVGLAMIFLAAGTNPLLLSPVFFLVLVLGRAYLADWARERGAEGPPRRGPAPLAGPVAAAHG
jgi:hypothetical protein